MLVTIIVSDIFVKSDKLLSQELDKIIEFQFFLNIGIGFYKNIQNLKKNKNVKK